MFEMYSAEIIAGFESIVNKIEVLNIHIKTQLTNLPVWIDNGANEFEANQAKLIIALANFGPTAGLSPQETFKCPGVVACTPETIKLIEQVNNAKLEFKKRVTECREAMDKDISQLVRDTLASAGYACVKLKQVFRQIVFINYHPRRIAWTKGKHTASKLLSKQLSQEMLIKAGQGEHIDIQIKKLNSLDNTIQLVKHRNIKPGWVVNIGTFKSEDNRSKYEDIRSALPLFYLHDKKLPNPFVCFSKQRNQARKCRIDKLIDSVPFLSSISVYIKKNKPIKKTDKGNK